MNNLAYLWLREEGQAAHLSGNNSLRTCCLTEMREGTMKFGKFSGAHVSLQAQTCFKDFGLGKFCHVREVDVTYPIQMG